MATYNMYELNAKDQFRTEFIERFVIVHQGDPKKTILYFSFLSKLRRDVIVHSKRKFFLTEFNEFGQDQNMIQKMSPVLQQLHC